MSKVDAILDVLEELGESSVMQMKERLTGSPFFKGVPEGRMGKTIGKTIYALRKDGRVKHTGPGTYKFVSRTPRYRVSHGRTDPDKTQYNTDDDRDNLEPL